MPGFSAYSGSLTLNATYVNISEALNAAGINANFEGAVVDFTGATLIGINTNATSKWTDGTGTDIYRLSNVGIGTSSIPQTLTVAGNSSVSSYLTVGANLNVGTTANIGGATALGSSLNVAGTANVVGATALGSTLNVAGTANVVGATALGSSLNVAGTANVVGATALGSTLTVEDTTTINDNLDVVGSSFEINKRHSNGGTRVRLYEQSNHGIAELYASGNTLTTRINSSGVSYFDGGAVGINTSIVGFGNQLEVLGNTQTTNLSATNVNATTGIFTTANATTFNGGTLVLNTALTANNTVVDFTNSNVDFTDANITGLAGDWLTNGSTLYYTAGSVAIGTAFPFSIFSTFSTSPSAISISRSGSYSNQNQALNFIATTSGENTGFINQFGENLRIGTWGASGDLKFYTYCNDNSSGNGFQNSLGNPFGGTYTSGNDNPRMVITNNGDVGIGRTDPPEKLTVSGITRIQENLQICGTASRFNSGIEFYRGDAALIMFRMGLKPLTAGNAPFDFDNTNGNETTFSGNGTERVRIENTGGVGIGQTNPQTLLDVNGNSRFTGGSVRNIYTANTASGNSSITLTFNEFTNCDSLVLTYTQVDGTVNLNLPSVNNSTFANKEWTLLISQNQTGGLGSISTVNINSTNAFFITYRTDSQGGANTANTISLTAGSAVSSINMYLLSTSPDVYALSDVMY